MEILSRNDEATRAAARAITVLAHNFPVVIPAAHSLLEVSDKTAGNQKSSFSILKTQPVVELVIGSPLSC